MRNRTYTLVWRARLYLWDAAAGIVCMVYKRLKCVYEVMHCHCQKEIRQGGPPLSALRWEKSLILHTHTYTHMYIYICKQQTIRPHNSYRERQEERGRGGTELYFSCFCQRFTVEDFNLWCAITHFVFVCVCVFVMEGITLCYPPKNRNNGRVLKINCVNNKLHEYTLNTLYV